MGDYLRSHESRRRDEDKQRGIHGSTKLAGVARNNIKIRNFSSYKKLLSSNSRVYLFESYYSNLGTSSWLRY